MRPILMSEPCSDEPPIAIAARTPTPNHAIATALPPYDTRAGALPITGRSASDWKRQYAAGTTSHSPKISVKRRREVSPPRRQIQVRSTPMSANTVITTLGNHLPNRSAEADIMASLDEHGR